MQQAPPPCHHALPPGPTRSGPNAPAAGRRTGRSGSRFPWFLIRCCSLSSALADDPEPRVQGSPELGVQGSLPVLRLRAQTFTHLTSKHLSHPSERRSRERRLHAVTSGSRAHKAPRRWSPTPRGLPRLHGRLVIRAVSLRLTRTTHTARTRKTPASPSATGSPSTSSRASRIAIKFTLPQPHLRHLHDGSTFRRDPRHRIRTW